MMRSRIMRRRGKAYSRSNETGERRLLPSRAGHDGLSRVHLEISMKMFLMAAVAVVSLGLTGAAFASPIVPHTAYSRQAQNSVVLPSQRPAYLA
jgi:hypothetical protein